MKGYEITKNIKVALYEIERKVDSLEYENSQLKIALYRMILKHGNEMENRPLEKSEIPSGFEFDLDTMTIIIKP